VKLNFAPGAMVPLNTPELLVAVCETVSLFVHVTAEPAVTVTGFGAYAALPIVCAPTGIVTGVPVVGPVLGVVGLELLLPHEAASARTTAASRSR
jgi:hypothetical protein